jgi:hypothetical protein
MKKYAFCICLVFIYCMISCSANRKNASQMDESMIAILPHKAISFMEFSDCKPAKLTRIDMNNIDSLLRKCANDYNPQAEKQYHDIKNRDPSFTYGIQHFILDLKRYKRQYVAVINTKGEKEVWVNCFCRIFDRDWQKQLIFVHDGGNCFFNLKMNLTQKKYYGLYVNGVS